jgi:phage portal protein BeeE
MRLFGRRREEKRWGELEPWVTWQGRKYPMANLVTPISKYEQPQSAFVSFIAGVNDDCGPVFSVVGARMRLFSEARFMWQRMRNGEPGDLFHEPSLRILERPWPNGTTRELLARAEQDVSYAGNFYLLREPGRVRRLRPDWVTILLTAPPAEAVRSDVLGYLYKRGGALHGAADPVLFHPDEIIHWSPIPDPLAQYRGMSWVTPVIREVAADRYATDHKVAFFDNSATPQLAVTCKDSMTVDQFKEFQKGIDEMTADGNRTAYKTMYLGGGADVTVVGKDMRQMAFKDTQGAGETRICAAGGVPPIMVGLSEGLDASTYSNYDQARRHFADGWAYPQWASIAASLEQMFTPPADDVRLWFDTKHIPMLREDGHKAAEILESEARTLKSLIDAGWEPDAAVEAVKARDTGRLKGRHTKLFSVQLQPAGANTNGNGGGSPAQVPKGA